MFRIRNRCRAMTFSNSRHVDNRCRMTTSRDCFAHAIGESHGIDRLTLFTLEQQPDYSSGRGRLPVCVVRTRFWLRCIRCQTLSPRLTWTRWSTKTSIACSKTHLFPHRPATPGNNDHGSLPTDADLNARA